jgi:hypothetical protein
MSLPWGGTGENWFQRRRDDHDVRQIGLSGSIQIRQEDGMEESISIQVEYPIGLDCTGGCPSKAAPHSGNLLNRFYTFSIARAGGKISAPVTSWEAGFGGELFKGGVCLRLEGGDLLGPRSGSASSSALLPGRPERSLPGLALFESNPPDYKQFNRVPV